MNKTTLVLLVASALAAAEAAAQTTGYLGATLLNPDVSSRNRFRFEEYRDLRPGLSIEGQVKSAGERYFWSLFGENLGRDDQFIQLLGGRYDEFKYAFTNNNIIHNLTFGAITPFGPVGSNTLTYAGGAGAAPTTNTALWNKFDYQVKHENLGGSFEWTAMKPWYFRATGNQKETRGIRPLGVPFTGSTGAMAELPMIIDFTTTDASAEVGYATRTSLY